MDLFHDLPNGDPYEAADAEQNGDVAEDFNNRHDDSYEVRVNDRDDNLNEALFNDRNDDSNEVRDNENEIRDNDQNREYEDENEDANDLIDAGIANRNEADVPVVERSEGEETDVRFRPCAVCLGRRPELVLYPCGHFGLCEECNVALLNRMCPVCREHIELTVKIFFA